MTKAELLLEFQSVLHSSSNDDIVALLKDILYLAAHEHVLDSSSVKGLLASMYDDVIPDDGVVSYVMNEYSLKELAEDYGNDDIIAFIEDYMNSNSYELLHWIGNDAIMAYVKHNININGYLSADLDD